MLATLAYTHGLAERLEGTGVTATAAMPAASATDMGRALPAGLVPYRDYGGPGGRAAPGPAQP